MSHTVGIVAEYNPFHTGHLYQIHELKKLGFDNIIVCMSGACVQRGQFALLSKFARAEMAIGCGVSVVAEMPSPFSLKSAEGFASAGIQTLKALNCDAVCFGAECDDVSLLKSIAEYLVSDEYTRNLKKYLDKNIPFAEARENALTEHFGINGDIIRASNNILAIEYLKSCIKLSYNPEIIIIKRIGADYNSTESKEGFASATALRNAISEYRFDFCDEFIPKNAKIVWKNNIDRGYYFTENDSAYEKALLYKIRTSDVTELLKIKDCNEELRNAIVKASKASESFTHFMSLMPTKRYTKSRIMRIVTRIFTDTGSLYPDEIRYIRILGIDKNKESLFREICKNCPLPISHSAKQLSEIDGECKEIASAEAKGCDIQRTFFKTICPPSRDFTTKFIKK